MKESKLMVEGIKQYKISKKFEIKHHDALGGKVCLFNKNDNYI